MVPCPGGVVVGNSRLILSVDDRLDESPAVWDCPHSDGEYPAPALGQMDAGVAPQRPFGGNDTGGLRFLGQSDPLKCESS